MANLQSHENRLEIYERQDDRWAWRLIVNNNVVASDASQGYENRLAAQTMAERIVTGEFADVPTLLITDQE